jgi:hypothetical protein
VVALLVKHEQEQDAWPKPLHDVFTMIICGVLRLMVKGPRQQVIDSL